MLRINATTVLNENTIAVNIDEGYNSTLQVFELNNEKMTLINKVKIKGSIANFFTPTDINDDGKKDLLSFDTDGYSMLNILIQDENNQFFSNQKYTLYEYYQPLDRFLNNAVIGDLQKNNILEILTVNGIDKFNHIYFSKK